MSDSAMGMGASEIERCVEMFDVPMFIVDVEPDGRMVFVKLNRCHEAATGMRSADVAGKAPSDFLPPRMAATIEANYRQCVERRESYTYEEVLRLPSGELWWETTLTPLFDEGGAVCRIVAAAQDITDRKERAFKNIEAISDLKKVNEELKLFSSMAAHDLRGPLGNIRNLIDLISEGFHDLGDNKSSLLRTCRKVADDALAQVDEILRYSRALSIEDTPPTEMDFSHLCADICALFDPQAKFSITYPALMVRADHVVLQMIIRNLVHNAIKYGGGAIMIDAVADPDIEGNLLYTVADNGAGFPAEMYEVGGALESHLGEETSGFGLAAVHHLVKTRGGAFRLDPPEFRTGATVRVSLRGDIVRDMLETKMHARRASA